MRAFITIITFLIFGSCSSTKNLGTEQISDKYQWIGTYGVVSTIEIKTDNTFEYKWQTGLVWGTTLGTWKKERANIILNSDLQPSKDEIEDFEIIKTSSKSSDSLSIKIISPDNVPEPLAVSYLKTDTTTIAEASTNFQGEAKLPRLTADSLIVLSIGCKTIRQKLDSSVYHYEFKLKERNEHYKFFTNEVWKYKNKRLYDPSIKKDKHLKKNYFEKKK